MRDLYFFVTITRRGDSAEFLDFFARRGIAGTYSTLCRGTARQKTLDLLGLEQTEKAAHFAMIPREKLPGILKGLSRELYIDMPDRGIALAIPVQSLGGRMAMAYFMGDQECISKEEKEMEPRYELIVAIAEKGYTDMVMDAARAAGATGGTILHTKGTGSNNAEQFFGVSISDEKEMVWIVAPTESKKAIMKSIMQQSGMHTKARALVFSLPVTHTAGFQWLEEDSNDEQTE